MFTPMVVLVTSSLHGKAAHLIEFNTYPISGRHHQPPSAPPPPPPFPLSLFLHISPYLFTLVSLLISFYYLNMKW